MTGAVDLSGLTQRAQQGAKAGGPPAGVEITEANFEAEVLVRSSQVPVVVLLWSPRSDACIQLADQLSGLAAADGGKWSLALVNVDSSPRVAAMFGVEAVPTVVALAGGQPLASFEGPQPPEHLRRWVDSLLAATAGKLGAVPTPRVRPQKKKPSTLFWRMPGRSWTPAISLPLRPRIRRSSTPTRALSAHTMPRPRARCARSPSCERATTHPPTAVADADAAPQRHRRRIRRGRRADPQSGCRRRLRAADRPGDARPPGMSAPGCGPG